MRKGFRLEIRDLKQIAHFCEKITLETELAKYNRKISNSYDSYLRVAVTESYLSDVIHGSQVVDANKMEDEFFPPVDADVFISHSHKDVELAKFLADWLYFNYGIKAFVDSEVWGGLNQLLKEMDDTYCRKENSYVYSYRLRNITTAHVHMLLNCALLKMIDAADCFVFLDTENSTVSLRDEIENSKLEIVGTNSPWLYSELVIVNFIRKRQSCVLNEKTANDSGESINLLYRAPIENLLPLTVDNLFRWGNKCDELKLEGKEALKILCDFRDN